MFLGAFFLIWKILPWKNYTEIFSGIIWKLYKVKVSYMISLVLNIRNTSWMHLMFTSVLVFRLGNAWEWTQVSGVFLSKFSADPSCILFLPLFQLLSSFLLLQLKCFQISVFLRKLFTTYPWILIHFTGLGKGEIRGNEKKVDRLETDFRREIALADMWVMKRENQVDFVSGLSNWWLPGWDHLLTWRDWSNKLGKDYHNVVFSIFLFTLTYV